MTADLTMFYDAIRKFNTIYRLENNESPTLLPAERLRNFKNILAEEVDEVDDIVARYQSLSHEHGEPLPAEQRAEVLTDVADWLGDIVVYCASEARRWGIPLDKVLGVIMESNFSKLGADGLPIYDERGKVMKGPSYWKPEPRIKDIIVKHPVAE